LRSDDDSVQCYDFVSLIRVALLDRLGDQINSASRESNGGAWHYVSFLDCHAAPDPGGGRGMHRTQLTEMKKEKRKNNEISLSLLSFCLWEELWVQT
jgi:hypothetical protein